MTDSWISKAERLIQSLSETTSGGKLLRIERVAHEQGISPQTVQHLLRAHSFLEHLRAHDPDLVMQVEALPYQALIALARWHARDRRQVVDYLAANPTASVRLLIAAEKRSRGLSRAGTPAEHAIDVAGSATGPLAPGEVLARLMTWARMALFDLETLSWEREAGDYARALGIEFQAVTPGGHRTALLVGPDSPTSSFYKRQGKSIWYNSVCASTLYSLVILLLPSKAAQSACLTSMPVPPSGDGNWPDWNSQVASRGRPRSGPIRPASPTGGIVMVTTPERICEDWQT